MSSLRSLQDDILRGMLGALDEAGPGRRQRGQSIEWDIPGGRAAVHASFIKHPTDFDTTVDVAVRFDAVQELVHRSNALLSPREKKDTLTIGCELGNLERGEPHRFTVSSPLDVAPALEGMVRLIRRVGLPYLERYSDLEEAYTVLSRDDRSAWLHSPVHAQRAMEACAALVVLGRPEEVARLAEKKRAFLESIRDPGLPAFERFLSDLPTS